MLAAFFIWNTFTAEKAAMEIERELKAAEVAIVRIEESAPTTYESFVLPLNEATRGLYDVWGRLGHILNVMNDEAWRKVEETYQPQMVQFSLRVGQSKKLYEIAKRIAASEKDPTRRRILEKMVQGAELSGVALEGAAKERFNAIQTQQAKLSMDFSNAVVDATKAFAFEKDGKTYTIDDASYPQTIKHCADREVREKVYRARMTRAPENAARIKELLALRTEEAKLLGFGNYGELSLATKCAPSVKAVMEMIDKLDAATLEIAAADDRELPHPDGIKKLEPWDFGYAAERLREQKYAYSEEELKKHFELEDVLKGMFRIANFLFDVEVRELTGAEKPSVWHPDVRFFQVLEKGAPIAHFYLDPYVRPGLKRGGAWADAFENRRKGVLPLSLMVTNFPQPEADGKCYLPFREVETVFHEFGHALQSMLTRIEDEGAAGINLVEWDAVEVASQFMENWCLDDRTGIKVPSQLKAKVRAAKNFRAAAACRRQLVFAKTDMQLHTVASVPSPSEVMRANQDHFGLPRVPDEDFLNAFTHIFAGGYSAGYYGYKWAEVMSADCFGAFEEAGLKDDAAVKALGRKYRETVLGLGGSISALEVFKRFRGRDPEIAAILRQQDLVK